jgi:hypothetical protein
MQPNHAHFGTDVGVQIIQWVTGHEKGCRFEKPSLRRSEQGSNHLFTTTKPAWDPRLCPSAFDAGSNPKFTANRSTARDPGAPPHPPPRPQMLVVCARVI